MSRSPSHSTHNAVFGKMGMNAVYVKFNLKGSEIHEFIEMAKRLDFQGFSVTMPLKQSVIKELAEMEADAQSIGAVNTIKIVHKTVSGTNTDGKGALDAIEEKCKVKGKRMVILGAGGAAKAVAWEAKQRGANIVVLNRTREKALELAKKLSAEGGALEDFPKVAEEGYDILVNCTSVGMYSERNRLPIDPVHIITGSIVMDAIPGEFETPLLQEALSRECSIICGNEMLMHQAVGQLQYWFGDVVKKQELQEMFQAAFNKLR